MKTNDIYQPAVTGVSIPFVTSDGSRVEIPGAKTLLSPTDIELLLDGMVGNIGIKHQDDFPIVLVIMTGAVKFASDLISRLDFPLEVAYITLKSYSAAFAKGDVRLVDRMPDVAGRNVIIVDDICDTGDTLKAAQALAQEGGATSVSSCVLLCRDGSLVFPNYIGMMVSNKQWVYGYGMDYQDNQLRHLPRVDYIKVD